MIVTVAEAKNYLRIDTDYEDALIEMLINSAEKLCADVAKMEVENLEENGEIAKQAVLFTLGYMFENRVDADYQKLTLNLRSLLFSIRE